MIGPRRAHFPPTRDLETAMTRFDGDERFPRPPAEVAAKLSDAAFLAGCLPEAKVSEAAADRAAWTLPPGFAVVPGQLQVELAVVGREPGRTALRVTSKALGASSVVGVALSFEAADAGTAVRWSAELERVTGLLRMVPASVLRSGMEKVIGQVWARLHARLDGMSNPPGERGA